MIDQWVILDEDENVTMNSDCFMEVMSRMDDLDDTGHKYTVDRASVIDVEYEDDGA